MCLVVVVVGLVTFFAYGPAGLLFLGIGCVGLAAIIYWHFARPEFEHAPPGTLPNVPEEPVIREGRTSFSWIPYELAREGTTVRMRVAKDPARFALPIVSLSLSAAIVGVLGYAFWFTERGQGVPLPFRILMVSVLGVAGAAIRWIFIYLRARELRKLEPLLIDRHERRLDFGELDLSFDQIIGLQLCAFARRATPHPAQVSDWPKGMGLTLELNLIWTEVPDRNPRPDCYRRQTLLLAGIDPRLGPFAAELAEALPVPLLYHATKEHWAREKRAARDRPLVKGSSI